MEDLLQHMGVVQDREEDILAKALNDHQQAVAAHQDKQKRRNPQQSFLANIAHTLIEKNAANSSLKNGQIEMEDGEIAEDDQNTSGKKIRKKSVLIGFEDESNKRPRTKLMSQEAIEAKTTAMNMNIQKTRANLDTLNNRILQNQIVTKRNTPEQNIASDTYAVPGKQSTKKIIIPKATITPQPTRKLRQKKKETTPRATPSTVLNTLECPICNQQLEISEENMVKHVERCSRRQRPSPTPVSTTSNVMIAYDSDASWIDSDEEEEDGNGVKRKSSSAYKKSHKKSHKQFIEENAHEADEEEEDHDEEEEAFLPSSDDTTSSDSSEAEEHIDDADMMDILQEVVQEGEEGEEGGNSMLPSQSQHHLKIADDWEEHDYKKRVKKYRKYYQGKHTATHINTTNTAINTTTNTTNTANTTTDTTNTATTATVNGIEMISTSYGPPIEHHLWSRLYPYQQEGCQWLYALYQEGMGGILADEMGLGKTAQACVHLNILGREGMQQQCNTMAVKKQPMCLIICPATVLSHWLTELHFWAPSLRSCIYHTISPTGKVMSSVSTDDALRVLKAMRKTDLSQGIAILTTYEGLRKHRAVFSTLEWTAIVLDEGQKIRNPTADITETCKLLPAYHRIILSGTPIQNSLQELWSLFDFIYPGRLGALPTFETTFALPIRTGAYLNATKLQVEVAIRCAMTLQQIVFPYLIRRKKTDLAVTAQLPKKTEHVLFCQLSPRQYTLYSTFLHSDEVSRVLRRRAPAFRAMMQLRKLCNHPILFELDRLSLKEQLSRGDWKQTEHMKKKKKKVYDDDRIGHQYDEVDGEDEGQGEEEGDAEELAALLHQQEQGGALSSSSSSSFSASLRIVWEDSGKLLVLSKILPLWKVEGHKVLIFSQTVLMLTIIEKMVKDMGLSYLRMDGTTPVSKRPSLIHEFNHNPSIYVMLLTTRTGGVGISLTAANRVILFDPDWNPMTDMQARERAWRLGQQREVTVYRLVMQGTIEEKIYQRQIYKLLLSTRVLENAKQQNKAMFSKSQLKELFELGEFHGTTGNGNNGNGSMLMNTGTSGGSGNGEREMVVDLPRNGCVAFTTTTTATATEIIDKEVGGYTIQQVTTTTEDSNTGSSYQQHQYTNTITNSINTTNTTNTTSNTGNNHQEENNDRKILQALFDGEALAAVYDHDYIEPGNTTSTHTGTHTSTHTGTKKKKGVVVGAGGMGYEAVETRHAANVWVSRALHTLQSSATVYTLPTLPTPTPPPSINSNTIITSSSSMMTSTSSHSTNHSSSHSSSSSSGIISGGQQQQQVWLGSGGSSSSASGISSSSGGNRMIGSAALLARLRGTSSSNGTLPPPTPSTTTNNHTITTPTATTVSTTVPPTIPSTIPVSVSMPVSVPIHQHIEQRLRTLFRTSSSSTASSLSTQTILSHFPDLGDQYAPLFRTILREVAQGKNGLWTLRKKDS